MASPSQQLRQLIAGMREEYARGGNAMAYAREQFQGELDEQLAILVAYDLQAGSYIRYAETQPESMRRWCHQLADVLDPVLSGAGARSILEIGAGEATTLVGTIEALGVHTLDPYGLDLSWSRCLAGKRWSEKHGLRTTLFVGDLFNIPLDDESIDVVYSSHSLEPNRGLERQAIEECLRVARHSVVLVEPMYELGRAAEQERMDRHGYVRGLREAAASLDAEIVDYRLLDFRMNPLNPSGVLVLRKREQRAEHDGPRWRCPLTGHPLYDRGDAWHAPAMGIAYPVLRGVPLLRSTHAVVASELDNVG